MLGVIANVFTVVLGSLIGMLIKKGIPKRISDAVMIGIGFCTIYIGISGALKGSNTLVLIISMALGAVIGELLRIDDGLNALGKFFESKAKSGDKKGKIAEGYVTASLLFCVGAMTVVGSLQAGLTGDCTTLYTKSLLDLVSSLILASTFGIGVLLSASFVFVLQGGIVLLAGLIEPFLSEVVINEMTCAGSVLIIALGLNIMGVSKFKVANYLPVILMPIIICPIYDFIAGLIAKIV